MNTYNFFQLVSESLPLVHSEQFADDAAAIAFLPALDEGLFRIIKVTMINDSESSSVIILDQIPE